MKKINGKKVEFIGRVLRQTYSSDGYKMYALDIDQDKYPNIKLTKYSNVMIGGNLHDLSTDSEYYIIANERNGTKGYMYDVLNIRKTELKSEEEVYYFLQQILTPKQAGEIYREYPNIVDIVLSGNPDNVVDLNKLKGIGQYTWDNIKKKIIENYALFDLINEFQGALTMSMLMKLYEKYPSIEMIRKKMQENPYKCLCGLSRVGFIKADSLLLEMEKDNIIKFPYDLKTSKQRCLACILYCIEENESTGSTKMSVSDLIKNVIKLTPACKDKFAECLNENAKHIYYDKETMDIALMRTYKLEEDIAKMLNYGLSIKKIWDFNFESYRECGGFSLSDEQLHSLELICKENIVILCGFAGSGKTATTNALIKMLSDNKRTFTLLSPTGRAAKVLKSYTGMPAATIHREYGYKPLDEWQYNSERTICTDIVIVDEASMSDVYLFYHLLDGIDFRRTKLFIIGDPAQLCSVGAGNILHDLIESKVIPTVMLSKIFRYSEGGLMQVATDTRNGKRFLSHAPENKYITMGKNNDFAFLQCKNEDILKNMESLYYKLLEIGIAPNDIMVLSAQNKGEYGTVVINNKLQKIANKNCNNSSKSITVGNINYYEDDIILQMENNYHASIYNEDAGYGDHLFGKIPETMIANGETMVIKEISPFKVISEIDGLKIEYTKADMMKTNLAYSISVHKSQGGSAKIVIFIVPTSHTFMLSSNLLYVGLTRTKEKCFVIGDLETINRSIMKKEENRRKTFLMKMLQNSST